MIAIPAITTVASNALIGTVTTKLVDSLFVSKFTQKQEKKKWLREKKLNLFSALCDEVLSISCETLDKRRKDIKEISSKIILLIDDKNLKTNIENYLFILEEFECYKNDINLMALNKELVNLLGSHMKRM